MANLTVEVSMVESVHSHPNADRLELIKLVGLDYSVISAKGNLKSGDYVFYFPINSILPPQLVEILGISSYYSGRIKPAKLRGVFSEGLVIKPETIYSASVCDGFYLGQDVTKLLGVTKYEPVQKKVSGGAGHPIGAARFDSPEHFKKFSHLLEEGETVIITEKIHGTNCVFDKEGASLKVSSHNITWDIEDPKNSSLPQIRCYKMYPELSRLAGYTLYMEVFGKGIQDLSYGKDDLDYAIFAIKSHGQYLPFETVSLICQTTGLKLAPVLYWGAYSKELVQSYNNKESAICPGQIMEGVCIVPEKERFMGEGNNSHRLCLKAISDDYLTRKDGTEYK
jgi:RNA ligase (TIGR02306 family)